MRKYTIIGVIVLMSISLLGVVGLQLYWINNAIKVKQELFERNVHDALAKVVDKLETREAVSVITNQMASLKSLDTLPPTDELVTANAEPVTPTKSAPTKSPKSSRKATAPNATTLPGTDAIRISKSKEAVQASPASEIVLVPSPPKPMRGLTKLQVRPADSLFKSSAASVSGETRFFYKQPDSAAGRKEFERYMHAATDTSIHRQLLKAQAISTGRTRGATYTATPLNNHKILQLSADTLRHLAISLDSLKPVEISSIQVRNDSVFIYKAGVNKPVHVYKPSKNVNNMFFRQEGVTPMRESFPVKIRGVKLSQAQLAQTTTLKAAEAIPAQKTATALKAEAIQKIEVKKEKLNEVVQKMMVEYVVRDIPLKERLNVKNFQALLSDELREKGIDMEYGYHVVSADQDTVAVKHVGQQPTNTGEDTKYFATFLFPNDMIEKPDYLAVYFPDTQSHVIRSLAGMMGLSGLFTLIIIATFATTIHIIYKQKRLSEMKNDFINNMTHEFKTPIATISLATDSIFNPKVYENPEKIKYYTSIIKTENKRMNAQVENVLQIALLEKNEFRLNLQPIDVHILLLKATESIQLQVEQRLGQISINLKAIKHELQSDEMHLFNVICNLLDNANKYSPTIPEIELSTQDVEGGLLIAVDDKGMGMSKETQKRVFEKFYRVPTGNLHNVKGFGLGLSYVKAIVEAHHGTIKLWSEPGKGSRFEICLPFKK